MTTWTTRRRRSQGGSSEHYYTVEDVARSHARSLNMKSLHGGDAVNDLQAKKVEGQSLVSSTSLSSMLQPTTTALLGKIL